MSFSTAGKTEFIDNVERIILEQAMNRKPNQIRALFRQIPWAPTDGDKVTFNSIALSGIASRVSENEEIPMVNPKKGNELSKTAQQYGDRLNTTKRMLKFQNRHPELVRLASQLVNRVDNVLDFEMTLQLFGEADQTTFTATNGETVNIATSDAKALFATDHSYGGVTFSNILSGAGALSVANLTTLIGQMQLNTPDDFGTNISPEVDTIIIADHIAMVKKCHELFGSALTPETANNAVNYYGGTGGFKVVALKYGTHLPNFTTSTDNAYRWLAADSRMLQESLQYQICDGIEMDSHIVTDGKFETSTLVTQFASFAAVQPQGIGASLSTTAPS